MAQLEQDLYTVQETAELLRLNPNTVYKWIRAGKLERVKISPRAVRVTAESIARLLAADCSQQ